jgi:four helix bundle protein
MKDERKKDRMFAFEDLQVWQKAVRFAQDVIKAIDGFEAPRNHVRITEDLEAAAISVSSNIALGKGRFSTEEFVRFLYIARGSLFETISQFTLVSNLGWTHEGSLNEIKTKGEHISKMLNALIKAIKEKSP